MATALSMCIARHTRYDVANEDLNEPPTKLEQLALAIRSAAIRNLMSYRVRGVF